MRSSMRLAFECPWCKRPCGYAMDRNGMVHNNETIGRANGDFIPCPVCKGPIEVMVNVQFHKKEK